MKTYRFISCSIYKVENMIREILGLNPQLNKDGSYNPSKFSLKMGTVKQTDYSKINYKRNAHSKNKILILFTEGKHLEMENDKKFSTGNHPIEALVPMLHFKDAGFEFEIVTLTGQPVIFEMWAFPDEDENIKELYEEFMPMFENPTSLESFVTNEMEQRKDIAAVFIPGGHGAMIDLPDNENVAKLLRWAYNNDLFTISICHGPGSFLSTTINGDDFLYEGYEMAAFPDSADKISPYLGYLPGQMKNHLTEPLKQKGAIIVNRAPDKTVCIDRKLITGASPLASNDLGKLAVISILEEQNEGITSTNK